MNVKTNANLNSDANPSAAPQPARRAVKNPGLPNPNKPVNGSPNIQVTSRQDIPNAEMCDNVGQINSQPPKKKSKFKIIAIACACLIVAGIGAGVVVSKVGSKEEVVDTTPTIAYENTGKYPIDNFISAINSYDAEKIASQVPNSWLALEWKYANSDKLREGWIKSVCSYVKVEYPSEEATMVDGESLTLSVVDYATLAETMKEDVNLIYSRYEESGYSPDDYDYKSEMVDLMLDYLLEKSQFPTKTISVPVIVDNSKAIEGKDTQAEESNDDVESTDEQTDPMSYSYNNGGLVVTPLANDLDGVQEAQTEEVQVQDNLLKDIEATGVVTEEAEQQEKLVTPDSAKEASAQSKDVIYLGESSTEVETTDADGNATTSVTANYTLVNDYAIDKLVFSSDDFHLMLDTFGSLINKYEYDKEDAVITASLEEYTEKKNKSDEKLKDLQDKARKEAESQGLSKKEIEKVVSKVKLSDKDAVPEYKEPVRKFNAEYVPESVIPYTWVGAYFSMNEYKGDSNKEAQVGDGSFEKPAGIGTTVITKVRDTAGTYHDVKVTLKGYRLNQDAVDYAVSYSEKNRGFDATSSVKLITYEVQVENLEDTSFTFDSEMFLSDAHSNQSSRTGKMYGFYSTATIKPHETTVVNDWATSTEMEQKYVCWGKSFNRQYPVVWFKLLAGSGDEVPEYDATTSYIQRSESSSEAEDGEGFEEEYVDEGAVDEGAVDAVDEGVVDDVEA